jgi:branched-chain amino acid transport system permease protein
MLDLTQMFSGYEIAHGIIGGLFIGFVYALLSAGFSLTWGVTRVINLAHSAFALIGSYITLTLLQLAGIDPLLSIIVIVPFLFVLGLGMHYFIIKPTAKRTRDITSASMVLCFGLFMIVENLLVVIFKSDDRVLHSRYSDVSFPIGPISVALTSVISLGIAVIALIAIYFFLNRTYMGKAVRAVWQDREGAMLSGINVESVTAITYGISLATAGVAGLCLVLMYSVTPYIGFSWLVFVFLIAIMGGLGSIAGVTVGGLIVGMIVSLGSVFIPFAFINLVLFVLLIIVLLIKPSGLFRR